MERTADLATTARAATGARAVSVSARGALALVVAASWLVRTMVAAAHGTPKLFPDEYIYAMLGRSLAHGQLEIRGQVPHFPALLEPILAAPLWRLAGDDIDLGYRLVQSMHALAVSLVAVPVYLIARRLALSTRWSLACAALAVLLPAGILSTYVMADPVAWPLALGAVAAGLAALDRPSWKPQLLFLVLAGMATMARVQYVVLPVAYLATALALERFRPGRALRLHVWVVAPLATAAVLALAAGPSRVLGYYRGVLHLDISPGTIGHWLVVDLFLLAVASGVALAPGFVVGMVAGAARPRDRAERAFAVFGGLVVMALLAEATLYASNGSDRFQERYLIALIPLVPIGFCLWLRRVEEKTLRIAAAAVAALLVVVAAAVPVTTFDQLTAKQDSPTLQAVAWLEQNVGVGDAAVAAAAIMTVLAALSVLAAWRPRIGAPAAAIGCGLALAAIGIGVTVGSLDDTARAKRTLLDADARWIDRAGFDDIAVLQTPFSSRAQVSAQMFWNASLQRILQMRDSSTVDAFGSTPTRVAPDGLLLAAGRPVTGPLLVEEYGSFAVLDDAFLVRRAQSSALWSPTGHARMTALVAGRYLDGWLGLRTRITIWPDGNRPRKGVLRMVLRLPPGGPRSAVRVVGPGFRRVLTVAPGEPQVLDLPLAHRTPWTVSVIPRQALLTNGGRVVSVMASPPKVIEEP